MHTTAFSLAWFAVCPQQPCELCDAEQSTSVPESSPSQDSSVAFSPLLPCLQGKKTWEVLLIIHVSFSHQMLNFGASQNFGSHGKTGKSMQTVLHNAFHTQIFFSVAFLYIKKEIVFKQWIMCRTKRQSGLSFLCGTSDNHHFFCGYYRNSASSAATFSGTLKKNLLKFSSLTNWKLGFMAPTGVCQCNNSASRWFWFLLKLLLAAAQELSLWCSGSHCSRYEQCLIHLPPTRNRFGVLLLHRVQPQSHTAINHRARLPAPLSLHCNAAVLPAMLPLHRLGFLSINKFIIGWLRVLSLWETKKSLGHKLQASFQSTAYLLGHLLPPC